MGQIPRLYYQLFEELDGNMYELVIKLYLLMGLNCQMTFAGTVMTKFLSLRKQYLA